MPFGVGQEYRVMLDDMAKKDAPGLMVVDRRDNRDAALCVLEPRVRGSIPGGICRNRGRFLILKLLVNTACTYLRHSELHLSALGDPG